MNLSDQEINDFNKYYNLGTSTMKGLVLLNEYKRKEPTIEEKQKIRESIYYFKEALGIFGEHFASLFFIGKLYQRLGEYEKAFEALEEALQYEHENHSLPMEAAIVAMHLGKVDKAVELSAESVKRLPTAATMGNHAMNLIIAQMDDEAVKVINQALEIDPSDEINQRIKEKIEAIIQGEEPRPTFEDTI